MESYSRQPFWIDFFFFHPKEFSGASAKLLRDHSLAEGQLDCFPSVATVYKAAINIHVQFLYKQKCLFLWDEYPGVQFLDSRVIARLIFKENAKIVLWRGYTILYQQCMSD